MLIYTNITQWNLSVLTQNVALNTCNHWTFLVRFTYFQSYFLQPIKLRYLIDKPPNQQPASNEASQVNCFWWCDSFCKYLQRFLPRTYNRRFLGRRVTHRAPWIFQWCSETSLTPLWLFKGQSPRVSGILQWAEHVVIFLYLKGEESTHNLRLRLPTVTTY